MARSYRKERLNERIRELIGELVQNRIKDPRIGLVTITAVSIAPDYASAKVYFTVMGDEEARAETRKGLESAGSYMRKAVGRELKLRQTPELRFLYDETLDRAMRIDEVIERTRRQEGSNEGVQDEPGDEGEGQE
jgi:ribosome-binding factor A